MREAFEKVTSARIIAEMEATMELGDFVRAFAIKKSRDVNRTSVISYMMLVFSLINAAAGASMFWHSVGNPVVAGTLLAGALIGILGFLGLKYFQVFKDSAMDSLLMSVYQCNLLEAQLRELGHEPNSFGGLQFVQAVGEAMGELTPDDITNFYVDVEERTGKIVEKINEASNEDD